MLRLDSDVSAFLICPVEIHIVPGVCLGDRSEVHHIHRTGKTGIEPAGTLDRDIFQCFFILCRKLCLSGGLQSSGASHESFGIFTDMGDTYGCTSPCATGTDSYAAILAFQHRVIASSDGNPIAGRPRLVRTDLTAGDVRLRFSVKHVDAYGAIDPCRAANTAGHSSVSQVRHLRRIQSHLRPAIYSSAFTRISISTSFEGNSGIAKPYAGSAPNCYRARLCELCEIRVRHNGRALGRCHLGILAHMGVSGVGHKSLRRCACHTGCAAGTKTIGQRFGMAHVLRFHREGIFVRIRRRTGRYTDTITYESKDIFIHHFYRCCETHAGITGGSCRTSCRSECGSVFCRDRNIFCSFYFSGAGTFLFIKIISDECPRVRVDIMGTGTAGTGKLTAASSCGCDRHEIFQRSRLYVHGSRIFKSHSVTDVPIGVSGVFLYVHRRTNAGARRESDTTGESEKLRCALGIDGHIAIRNIISPFAQVGIRLLRNHIHRHRAASRKRGRATSSADCHSLRRGVTVAIAGRTIVCIVCRDGERLRLHVSRLRISLHIGVIHHDRHRRTSGALPYCQHASAQSGAAVIACVHGESGDFHFFIIHMGIGGGGNPVSCARERACHISSCRTGDNDGRDGALLFRGHSGLATQSVRSPGDCAIFHIRIRVTFDEVHSDGRAHGGTLAAGEGDGAGVGVDFPFIRRANRYSFIRLNDAVFHVSVGDVVHPVQRNLSCHRSTFGATAAAGCDV